MKHNSQNQQAYNSLKTGTKLLSVLLDPDKCLPVHLPEVFAQLPEATTHIFVGGSTVDKGKTHELVSAIRGQTQLPVWIFPGDADQITASLISMIKKYIHCPLIVGGGLRTSAQMKSAWDAGADMLVVGTALEEVLSLR